MIPIVHTYNDVLEELSGFLAGLGRGLALQSMRSIIQAAYKEVSIARRWSFLQTDGQVAVQEPYSTGTVEYTESTKVLTLTDGTWPTWMDTGASVQFDDHVTDVAYGSLNVAMNHVILLEATAPPADVAAGTTYTAFPRYYTLPNDFEEMLSPRPEEVWSQSSYVSREEVAYRLQNNYQSGTVRYHSIGVIPDLHETLGMFVYPVPDAARRIPFIYKRKARPLRKDGTRTQEFTGFVSTTAGFALAGSVNIPVGTLDADWATGSVMRISETADPPSGPNGDNPYVEQRTITSIFQQPEPAISTTFHLDAEIATTRINKGFRISDPIDLHSDVYEAFLRCVEKHAAHRLRSVVKDYREIARVADEALTQAMAADGRDGSTAVAGRRTRVRSRLADSPLANRVVGG